MDKKYKLTIGHLYPKQMNLYGDRGNILALYKRAMWRGIDVRLVEVEIGQSVDFEAMDILFMGGGQDRGQELISEDLLTRRAPIFEAIENYLVCLLVCGGYQMFGNYFKTFTGKELKGLGILDLHTLASEQRMIGDMIVDIRDTSRDWQNPEATIVGFENHSGKTYLGSGVQPLGKVLKGFGNNGEDKTEGAFYRHCFGTYLHGSLLPKNPVFADHLILSALKRRYGIDFSNLTALDDKIEDIAHDYIITNRSS